MGVFKNCGTVTVIVRMVVCGARVGSALERTLNNVNVGLYSVTVAGSSVGLQQETPPRTTPICTNNRISSVQYHQYHSAWGQPVGEVRRAVFSRVGRLWHTTSSAYRTVGRSTVIEPAWVAVLRPANGNNVW